MWLHLLSLLTALGFLAGLSLWLRRRAEVGGEVRVIAQRRLDAHHSVWIVEVEGQRLLLGGGRDHLSLIKELEG